MTTFFSITSVYDQLTDFANLSNFWSLFNTAFGSSYDSAKAATFKDQWQNQDFSLFPPIEVVSNGVLGSANGAYGISTNRIYLSDAFISRASQQSLEAVILEEFGHFVDAKVNSVDTVGDEGAIFAALVQGQNLTPETLQAVKAENDHSTITINGATISVENAVTPIASTGLNALLNETGKIYLSVDGNGTTDSTGVVQVLKNSGATVRTAYLVGSGTNGAIGTTASVNGADISWERIETTPWGGGTFYSYLSDVTSILKSTIDSAVAGTLNIAVNEGAETDSYEGLALAVLFDDPSQTRDQSVILYFGGLKPTGDTATINFGAPVNTSTVLGATLGLGIGYSYNSSNVSEQVSQVEVNNQLLTSVAGNADDGQLANSGLFTVGGVGDNTNNPSPTSTDPTTDDELYNLLPFIKNGDTSLTLNTVNPSNDDHIFFAHLTLQGITGTVATTVVTLSVLPASVAEDGTPNLVYTFTRTEATTSALTVNYIVGGTADNSDYTGTTTGSKTITFAAGSATATLTVNPTADATVESNETVALTLVSGTGYAIGTSTAVTGTITNDDPTITIAVAPTSVLEDGTPNLVYTFTRTGLTTNALTVNYGITGTATNGTDYATIGTTATFSANSATAIVTVNPTADTTIEANETVALTLATGTGYTIGTTTAVTGTITNDDVATVPNITLAVAPASVLENGTSNLVYTFTRTGATTSALTVNYSIGGTTTNGTDYTSIGTSVTFAAGSTTATVTIDPTADTTIEANETVILTLASGTGYTIGTTTAVTGTITNDDLPSITLAVAPVSVLEDETTNLVYTFTRTGSATSALTVNYGITGTAAATDYTGATPGTGKTITFAPGSAIATLTIDPTADTTIEHSEIVILTLASGTGYTIGTTTAVTGTITNDDTTTTPTVTLALNYSGISENSPSNFIYTFKRTGSTTNALTVNYSIAGTATATDYIGATPGTGKTITFAANSATATLTIDPTADTTLETDETISLQLTTGTGYSIGTTNPQIATIINDDGTRRQKGTSGKDVILGTNLRDILSGDLGNDVLTGGLGGDSFSFNAPNERIDTITDFSVGNDDLFVKGSGFGGGLVSGDIIISAQFVIGTAATNTSQRFIYNSTNGALSFDVDGSGATAASQFAILSPNLALNYQDIFVI